MTDDMIVRIAETTCRNLERMEFFVECRYILPSYNALLAAAKENHPEDAFLNTLPFVGAPMEDGKPVEISPPGLAILFSQLRIALEMGKTEKVPGESHGYVKQE